MDDRSAEPRLQADSITVSPEIKTSDYVPFSIARKARGASLSCQRPLNSSADLTDSETIDKAHRQRNALGKGINNYMDREQESAFEDGRADKYTRPPRTAEGHDSDFSSNSASDEVEMEQMLSDDSASEDDEETGLTQKKRKRRRGRRKQMTDLDSRIGGTDTANQGNKRADRKVLTSLFINALLIGSWYLFSLSISIVSRPSKMEGQHANSCVPVQYVDVLRQAS